MPTPDTISDLDTTVPAWERKPSAWSRFAPRIGIQGKLILCVMMLLGVTLGASCGLFLQKTQERLRDIIAQQAQQLATALAWSSEDPMSDPQNARSALELAAGNLVKGRNIISVVFYDVEGAPIVQRSRDPDSAEGALSASPVSTKALMRAQPRQSKLFGEYVEVVAPIISSPRQDHGDVGSTRSGRTRLLGYVAVGISGQYEATQMQRINMMVVGIGCVAGILSLPLAYLLVRRIFHPIRQLVGVARRIASGDLNARVEISRSDVIGELARTFDEMVQRIKQQQQDVRSANDRLAEANRDLERKVEQRTAQFETANRRLSQEIAEKEEFLRAVSHDLNAPLRNISGMATMLLMKNREKFDEDVIHRLERIKSNVDAETDLISELLELSRIKTRRQKMELVDMEQLIWELRGLFENDLKSKGIDLVIDTTLPAMHCERARIRQVFQNLIDNAIKYMGENFERRIHVGCRMNLTEAEFYVRDTGMGIDPDDIEKVFFVFRRGKGTATQNIAGKGVGLASVKSIIETYNGRIWVESRLGEGSAFRFTINGMYVPTEGREAAVDAVPRIVHIAQNGEESEHPAPPANPIDSPVRQPTAA